jgi:hypothetical protein
MFIAKLPTAQGVAFLPPYCKVLAAPKPSHCLAVSQARTPGARY